MASGVTYQAIDRLTYLPTRSALKNGEIIGGQLYYDIWFTGGEIQNVNLVNCIFTPGGGGGGVTTQTFVTTGTSGTCPLNGFLGFKSATTGAKTAHIPASAGTLNLVIIADLQGTADSITGYPITIVPTTGSIVGGQNQIYTNYGSVTLLDTSQGWVST